MPDKFWVNKETPFVSFRQIWTEHEKQNPSIALETQKKEKEQSFKYKEIEDSFQNNKLSNTGEFSR